MGTAPHDENPAGQRSGSSALRPGQSKALWRRAEELAALGSFEWNPRSGELWWSDEHFRLWGIEPGAEPASLQLLWRGLHPDDLERFQRETAAVLRCGGLRDTEYRVCRPDGSTVFIRDRAEVTLDADGRAQRMVGTVLDLTTLRVAEEALHRYDFIFNVITDPVSVIDGDLVYHSVNDAWCRVTRLKRSDVIGRFHAELMRRVATDERVQALRDCLADRQPRRMRNRIDFDGKGARWWETALFPYDTPHAQGRQVVLWTRDVDDQVQAQEALAASVDNLKITLNATGDGIFATDAESDDQPLLFVNDRVLEMFQVPEAHRHALTPGLVMALAGRFFIDPDAESARVRATIAGGRLVEDRLVLADGRTLLRRCEPTTVAGRRARVWTFRDITAEVQAQQALAQSEAQQRALLEAFPGYIACFDAQMRCTFVNPRLCTLLGRASADLVGRTVREMAPQDLAELTAARVARALAGESLSYEHVYPAPDGGELRHVMYTLAPGAERGSGSPMCNLFGTDITGLKRTEAALIRARDDAEEANRAKSAFLSSMSHELRTPLNAVLGFAQLLAADATLGARQQEWIGRIIEGGQHLLVLINDLLDLSRIEAGRIELRLEPVALPALAAECLRLVAGDAATRGVALSALPSDLAATPALEVLADRRRLQQVLLNLLGNAIKYNRTGGWVRLQWSHEGAHVRVSVRDGGPGIDRALQPRLFQVFDRLGADRGGIEGTGIGLALCRRLVHLMRGEIGVDSEPGRGSDFWFTLAPAPQLTAAGENSLEDGARTTELAGGAPAAATLTPRLAARGAATRRVLCIEDNPVNLLLIEAMIESIPDMAVRGVAEPRVGLDLAIADPPDLLLLDIQMPEMDGYEVLRRLRESPATREMPVIAVSANAMPQDVARGLAAGFNAYLAKPVALPALIRAVHDALSPLAPAE